MLGICEDVKSLSRSFFSCSTLNLNKEWGDNFGDVLDVLDSESDGDWLDGESKEWNCIGEWGVEWNAEFNDELDDEFDSLLKLDEGDWMSGNSITIPTKIIIVSV